MFLVLFFGSIVFAMAVPGIMKRTHVRRQNHLLARCRALYVFAVEALELGDDTTARAYLRRIRRIESRWRYGNSITFRIAFALWAICAGALGYIWLRALSFFAVDVHVPTVDDLRKFAEALPILFAFGTLGALHALGSYLTAWMDWWLVDDCGDRLERIIKAERHVAIVPEEDDDHHSLADGLTPEQIFGLGRGFTRRQLDRARRRLVAKLHPDLWYNAKPSVRRAHEEALKRVNAAYDLLRPLAT